MAPVRLRHIHLPASPTDGALPTYKTAAAVQELLRRRLLNFKDKAESSSARTPTPALISFTPQPTYTLGRRQAQSSSSLSPAEIARLKAPLHIRLPKRAQSPPALGVLPSKDSPSDPQTTPTDDHVFRPAVLTSPRGGLATYHGPGQVVLWPVMVVRSSGPLGYKQFTVRCYSRLLENSTIALLQRLFGLQGFLTEDPGVWVRTPSASGSGSGEVRKISALGIHLRRHVSSLGAAINLDMPNTTSAFAPRDEDEETNPWARFVACGLQGKGVTCVQQELLAAGGGGIPGLDSEIVARAWAEELAMRMELDPRAVETVKSDEIQEIIHEAKSDGHLAAVEEDEI